MNSIRLRTITIVVLVFAVVFAVSGEAVEPISGAAFDSLIAAQNTVMQRHLTPLSAESCGCFVTGPLDPLAEIETQYRNLFTPVRIVCPDEISVQTMDSSLHQHDFILFDQFYPREMQPLVAKYTGLLYCTNIHGPRGWAQVGSVQVNRFLIWLHRAVTDGWLESDSSTRTKYENAVYQYLMSLDSDSTFDPPKATAYNLPAHFDLYAEPPDYVIQGYQNYKDYLHAHAELTTEFASGITAFVPTTATLDWMKANAPREAHPNKEAAALQQEYHKFFERGGDTRIMQTLTHSGYDTLKSGEYFFAVGLNGTIRFGREMPREEVERFEREKRRKVPRANHAFLFPGEPVLTAGAFFIDERADNKLVKVNAQSGHYFYSNISESIRDDIAIRSDHYLMTLGHFFIALDRLGITYEGILISKL